MEDLRLGVLMLEGRLGHSTDSCSICSFLFAPKCVRVFAVGCCAAGCVDGSRKQGVPRRLEGS